MQSAFYENNSWYLEPVFSKSLSILKRKVLQDALACIIPVLQLRKLRYKLNDLSEIIGYVSGKSRRRVMVLKPVVS